MKITDLLKRESVELSRTPESKGQAIDQMVELMAKGGNINDLQRYQEGVLKREEERQGSERELPFLMQRQMPSVHRVLLRCWFLRVWIMMHWTDSRYI